ncbi:MAG: hypothetical protein ACE37F_35050 [Nannocystaceae bacterium]
MEQFLAITVALGCAGAVGYAVYADRAQMQGVIAGVEEVAEPIADPEPAPSAEEVAAAIVAPVPMPAEPTDLDTAAGIPPVVPDDPESYAPGPTTEMDQWQ